MGLVDRLISEQQHDVLCLQENKVLDRIIHADPCKRHGYAQVELNGQRITASSAFTGTAGAVEVDGVTLHAPYQWIAIGDPDIIGPALKIPGGALAQVRNNGGHGTVDAQDRVQVTAVRAVPDPVYATPVPPDAEISLRRRARNRSPRRPTRATCIAVRRARVTS